MPHDIIKIFRKCVDNARFISGDQGDHFAGGQKVVFTIRKPEVLDQPFLFLLTLQTRHKFVSGISNFVINPAKFDMPFFVLKVFGS